MVEYFTMFSDSSSTESGVLFALIEHIHVWLAHVNAALVGLEAVHERLVEAVALILLSRLLVGWLSILSLHGCLLHGSLLLLLNGSLLAVVWVSTAHNSSDGLVSDFWTNSNGHTSGESTTEAWHHSTTLSRGRNHGHARACTLSRCGVIMMMNLLRGCLLDRSGWSSGASWTETWWTSTWTSWSSYNSNSVNITIIFSRFMADNILFANI